MDRNRFLMIAIVVIAVVFIFNPFGRRQPAERLYPSYVKKEVLDPIKADILARAEKPEDYVAGLFDRHDIVFLGEFPKIKQQVQFVSGLIPVLYRHGVTNLGIEHALASSQGDIDALLSAATFDEARARRIFFDFIVLWGFEEYEGLLRSAWQLNRSLPPGAKPFRIVGLNVRRHWEYLKTEDDIDKPEVVRKVLSDGVPDRFMADTILREFVDKGEKALIFLNLQSGITRYRNHEYEKNAQAKGLSETRRTGNIVYERIGDRAVFVPMHAPWPDKNTLSRVNFPVDGVLDRIIAGLPKNQRRLGFDVRGTPVGALEIKTDVYRSGYDKLTLGDFCDGYVILGPLSEYETVTPIPDFITDANVDQALADFPGPKEPRKLTPAELNRYISQDVENLKRVLDQFE
jgi:hypothetical protein